MIPADLASRLLSILETSVQPIAVSREISDDLPKMVPGERFTAQIQRALPDGTFQALVAGKMITLALPGSAKTGDVLELTASETRGGTLHARLTPSVETPAAPASTADARPMLSQTGQLISQLLTGRYGEAKPLPLAPVISAAPGETLDAIELAPALKQAISQSGMFYESHLKQWVDGARPLQLLLTEPQAALTQPTQDAPEPHAQTQARTASETSAQTAQIRETTVAPARDALVEIRAERNDSLSTPQGGLRLPESVTPVVLQQLETLATQQAAWQGQIWPGAQMQWSIVDPDAGQSDGTDDSETILWRSQLRLSLPQLGELQASLTLGPQGVSIRLGAAEKHSAELMRDAQGSLQDAFDAAGIPLTLVTIREDVGA